MSISSHGFIYELYALHELIIIFAKVRFKQVFKSWFTTKKKKTSLSWHFKNTVIALESVGMDPFKLYLEAL